MGKTVQMPERGTYIVDDDSDGVLATALAIATSPLHAPLRSRQLAPGGDGYHVEIVAWIRRGGAGDEDEDDAPEDTWTLCRVPDAKRVLDGNDLRGLVADALALRVAFPRTVTMNRWGSFTVTDDDRDTIGTALLVATAPQHANLVEAALRPGGSGLRVEGIGSVNPIEDPEDLDYPFSEDPTLNPATLELWRLFRDSDGMHGGPSELIITGDELRALVKQAVALRVGFRPAPLTQP